MCHSELSQESLTRGPPSVNEGLCEGAYSTCDRKFVVNRIQSDVVGELLRILPDFHQVCTLGFAAVVVA